MPSAKISLLTLPLLQIIGIGARKDAVVGLVRILTESQSILGQPALWSKLLVTCVELCEHEPHDGASLPSGTGGVAPAASFLDETEELDCYDNAVGGSGVGAIGGGEEYSAAFSRLTFSSSKVKSAFPHIPDARRWLVDALARLGGRFPGRVPGMIDASPVATTVRAYASTASIVIS